MAFRAKRWEDMKQVEWISSSFADSFGLGRNSDDDCRSPGKKRAKFETAEVDIISDISSKNILPESGCTSSKNKNKVWTDKYSPKTLEDLIVHKKKVSEVSDYLINVFNHNRYNRILLITGPPGCGKTCTLSILCRHLKINIMEWVTPIDNGLGINDECIDNYSFNNLMDSNRYFGRSKRCTIQSFNEFILQSAKYPSLLSTPNENANRKVVLIKDFPTVFMEHPVYFHEVIKNYYNIDCKVSPNYNISPLVFINSDTNIIRELFPDDLKTELNVTSINFNPVTQINIVKALERVSSLEFNRTISKSRKLSKEELINIAETSDGDLRSAILKLQFNFCNSISVDFKFPRPAPNVKSERIRVMKTGSKLKSVESKHKICEIDKDKTVDFFNSIGRVLYPKKEYCDNKDNMQIDNYRFVHSPSGIADVYATEPHKFVNSLHENYLDRFTDIKDVCKAAESISLSDVLLSSSWEAKGVMVSYSLNMVVHSLMVSNSKPAPNTFRPISKSKIWVTDNKKKINRDLVRQIFPDIQCEKDVLLDVIPYLNRFKKIVNLTKDQDSIISKIAQFN